MFIDQARILVKAGSGGHGACSFRREKYVPRGGPDGGDGGDGGNVLLKASTRVATLLDFRYQRHYEAPSGLPGQGSNKFGSTGEDIIIPVPVGTIVKDGHTEEILADLVEDQQTIVIANRGKGGRGNSHFATSTNRAPRQFETGTPGEERALILELKLLADVGLVGFPSAPIRGYGSPGGPPPLPATPRLPTGSCDPAAPSWSSASCRRCGSCRPVRTPRRSTSRPSTSGSTPWTWRPSCSPPTTSPWSPTGAIGAGSRGIATPGPRRWT